MKRRTFLQQTTAAVAFTAASPLALSAAELPVPSAAKLPRWRGFNLLEKFTQQKGGNPGFREEDFRMIADFGKLLHQNFRRLVDAGCKHLQIDEPYALRVASQERDPAHG